MIPRSFLFVPGDQEQMLRKAAGRGADALIVDLEDAVAPVKKEEARSTIRTWLARRGPSAPPTWIRINAGELGRADIDALADTAPTGLMIAKASNGEEVRSWQVQAEQLLPNASLLVLIETAGALRNVDEIASIAGVSQLMIGEADLGASLGIAPEHSVWDSLRAELVLASNLAQIAPPIGPVEPDFSNPKKLEEQTRQLRRMGFLSRAVIHPAQIDPVHRALTPTPDEIEKSRAVVSAHEEALASGAGAYVDSQGAMVDEAVIRRALQVLATVKNGERQG